MRGARIAFSDIPDDDSMALSIIVSTRVPGGKLVPLLSAYTQSKDGTVVRASLTVGRDGWIRVQVGEEKFEQKLDFVPTRFGAGALGGKGWIRFLDDQIA